MADFELAIQGAEFRRWTDPVGPNGEPSRIRPRPGFAQLYPVVTVGQLVTLIATPFGASSGPPDTALGGRLFFPFLVEGFGPPMFVSIPGQSSIIAWTPGNAGHHLVGVRRPNGGAVLMHVDVKAT